jgi:hypothetical protein
MNTDRNALRRALVFGTLAAVVAWSAWLAVTEDAGETDDDAIELARPAGARPARPSIPVAAAPAGIKDAPRLALARANLFPEQTWYVPPPPPPPPAYVPPPPPQAPPLPFVYMGRWQEAGEVTYYLMRGTLPVSAHAGEVIDGAWRLEPVSGGLLNFTYLPLNQTRSLRAGE